MPQQHPIFLMPQAAATRLHVSAQTVRNYVAAGRLAVAGYTTEGYRLFHEEEVERLRRELQAARTQPREQKKKTA